MARQRKNSTDYPIKYVHEANGRIVYRPLIPVDQRDNIPHDKRGFLRPPIKLGKPGDDPDAIFAAYLEAKKSIKLQQTWKRDTLGWIVDTYMKSRQFAELAPSSQKRAPNLARIIEHEIKINGKPAPLGKMHISNLTKPILHQIAEKRLMEYQNRGKKGIAQVNRETTFLSTAISWACNYVPDLSINSNPLRGYIKLKESPDKRYVTHEEYEQQLGIAAQVREWLPPLIELTYLLATRGAETLDIRLSDCTEEGIRTHRRKGSADNIIKWSPRLITAYKAALKLHEHYNITVADPYLICKSDGSRLSSWTISAGFRETKTLMEEQGLEKVYWSLHQIKAKGVSDSEDKTIAGHKTEAMRQRYDRKIPTKKAVN